MALLVAEGALLGCETHWTGAFVLEFNIRLDEPTPLLEGVEIWLLDGSRLVTGKEGRRGVFVCRLDEEMACDEKVEYWYQARRAPWNFRASDKAHSERFTLVVIDETLQVQGTLPFPDLSALQVQGYHPVEIRSPILPLSLSSEAALAKRLRRLESWQERRLPPL